MQKLILSCLFWSMICAPIFAQVSLEGSWVGTITTGGLNSKQTYKFELVLARSGKNSLKGRSFVHVSPSEVIEMDIAGKLYGDQSIYLEDLFYLPSEGREATPPYDRKYELIFNRSIWDSNLEGFWQEKRPDPFFPMRSRGRIFLKKKKASGA